MERRLATFLYADEHYFFFMEVESYDQHAIPKNTPDLPGPDLRDGCEVYLTFDSAENLVAVELVKPARNDADLHHLYQRLTGERFDSESIKVLSLGGFRVGTGGDAGCPGRAGRPVSVASELAADFRGFL